MGDEVYEFQGCDAADFTRHASKAVKTCKQVVRSDSEGGSECVYENIPLKGQSVHSFNIYLPSYFFPNLCDFVSSVEV